jgi:peptidyl-prolyl cis-trans isomerase SurA
MLYRFKIKYCMKNLLSIFVIFIMLSTNLAAQKNTIVTIDGRPVSTEEFETIYKKNNSNLNDENEVKSPQEYMKMFIDFKLKVIEAENRGLDTTQSFIDELAGYREELAKTYLTDVGVTDSIVKLAYYRTKNLVKVSHILIQLTANASPEDTLKAYNKMIDIRNQYLNKEKTFGELAKEYSEDTGSANDSGSLPYFTAFKMITPFENAAFSTKVGEISMPIRTQVGFHLIKSEDLKPSQGEIKVAHIMKKFSNINEVNAEENQRCKAFIDSVYTLLQNGADFGSLAKELSDDNISAKHDGVMKFISQDFAIPEFADAAFSLKSDGDYSKPIMTKYGWHIIKRLEHRPVPTFEEMEVELTKKVKADPLRSKYSKMKFIENMKKEYGFSSYNDNIKKFNDILSTSPDTLYKLPEDCEKLVLFKFAGKENTADSYFKSIYGQYHLSFILKFKFINGLDEYINQVITAHENSMLEEKYPEFKYLIKEYHDGILLFSIMESEVWNKAIEDSLGLTKFYEQNKGKFLLGEHFDGLLIKCVDEDSKKLIEQSIEKGITDPDSLMQIANKDEKKNIVTKGRWEKGANRQVDYLVWKGEKPHDLNENLQFVSGSIKENGIKTLDEARGLYISDYQATIEKDWLQKLHAKYTVQVNDKLLRKVKSIEKKK